MRWLTAIALALFAAPALACSCLQRSEEQIIDAANGVVVGIVTEIRRLPDVRTILATNSVGRIVKGRVLRQITVRTPNNSAACGLSFQQSAS